jgi:chromosome segregation ATPase
LDNSIAKDLNIERVTEKNDESSAMDTAPLKTKMEKTRKLKKVRTSNDADDTSRTGQQSLRPLLTKQDSKTNVESEAFDCPDKKTDSESEKRGEGNGHNSLLQQAKLEELERELASSKDLLAQSLVENERLYAELSQMDHKCKAVEDSSLKRSRALNSYQKQLNELQEYVSKLHGELEQEKNEKESLLTRVQELETQLNVKSSDSQKNSIEWIQRYQSLQESTSNQILRLSSDLDTVQREWTQKVDRIQTELKREKYDKESIGLQLKLKQVQCEKSDRETYHAKTMIARLQDELRKVLSDREKLSFQLLQSQASVRELSMKLSKFERPLQDPTTSVASRIITLQDTMYKYEKTVSDQSMTRFPFDSQVSKEEMPSRAPVFIPRSRRKPLEDPSMNTIEDLESNAETTST